MRPVEVFEDAKCIGEWAVFDSLLPTDHTFAKSLCDKCPAILPCLELLREQQISAKGLVGQGGGPHGTWAGRLVGKSKTARADKEAS